MKKGLRWATAALAGLFVLLLVLSGVLLRWANSADFRARVEQQATAALGAPLHLGALSVNVWPPAVVASDVQLQMRTPVRVEHFEARPDWPALLRGRADVGTLVARGAVLPLANGQSATLDATARLADDGLLERFEFRVLQGRLAGAQGELTRAGDHWPLRVDIGGGHIRGKLRMEAGKAGARLLTGDLTTVDVEVAALTAPARTLTGKLQAQTRLRAEFRDFGALGDAMQTQTQFTVRNAVVHGIDLLQAVRTVGLNRGGSTALDTLAGQVSTQGHFVQLSNLVATSGPLSATGQGAIAPSKSLSGRVNVDVAGSHGAFGVPLVVGGTLDAPTVTLTRGALAGAALGTLLAPGAGTGAGAKLGDKLESGLRGLLGK
jgi:uncharacterized protein involved in outer membrane biogenesis